MGLTPSLQPTMFKTIRSADHERLSTLAKIRQLGQQVAEPVSARNFYGFKFRLLTKYRFPRSLISLAIETPHLCFPLLPSFAHTPEDKTDKMDFGS